MVSPMASPCAPWRRAACRHSSRWAALLLAVMVAGAAGQFQFEIPQEMLQGMFGGGGGGMQMGGGQQRHATEWPKTEDSTIGAEYEWLVNTEWKGKTAKYMLLRDGIIESPLKECEPEGQCLWAANNERVVINTPTLKVMKFLVLGLDKADRKKLENKDETELRKIKLQTEKAGKSGKKSTLDFERIAAADTSDTVIAEDLYKILAVPEDADQSTIKKSFRTLSIKNHPDKGGDAALFAQLREAYEVLSDADQRRYYDMGGFQLVKNMDHKYKEVEGQKAQLEAQLNQVPKNHPQRKQFEMQIEQQKKQFDRANVKHDLEQKMRSEDLEVHVPISAQELYAGVSTKVFEFKRLTICRGCRVDPAAPECIECGRCPPEKLQVPKYGNTPFGKQVVGMAEKEQESRERCREQIVKIDNVRIPKGAKEGSTLKKVPDIGHQTPGKIPGRVVFKVKRGSPDDTYTIAEADLYTVLHISLEQALFGFNLAWTHLGEEQVTVAKSRVSTPDEVVRLKKKGLVGDGGARGDLFVRLAINLPVVAGGDKQLTVRAPESKEAKPPTLSKEDPVEIKEGGAWRRWRLLENAKADAEGKSKGKDEL